MSSAWLTTLMRCRPRGWRLSLQWAWHHHARTIIARRLCWLCAPPPPRIDCALLHHHGISAINGVAEILLLPKPCTAKNLHAFVQNGGSFYSFDWMLSQPHKPRLAFKLMAVHCGKSQEEVQSIGSNTLKLHIFINFCIQLGLALWGGCAHWESFQHFTTHF